MPSKPKSSKLISNVLIGQFVTPQNSETMPIAAQRDGLKPSNCPKRQPSVAPT